MDCMDAGLEKHPIQAHPTPGSDQFFFEAVIESLEQALTAVDTSDGELSVRAVTGRHVVRMVGEPEQSSEVCRRRGEAATRLARGRVRRHYRNQTVEFEALSWEMCSAGWSNARWPSSSAPKSRARLTHSNMPSPLEQARSVLPTWSKLTSLDDGARILSVNGVEACDSISHKAMLQGVADMVDGEKIIPFIRQFNESFNVPVGG